jgi:predicted transcriptional regulator
MKRNFTIDDILSSPRAGLNKHLAPAQEQGKKKCKRVKFGNRRVTVDDREFDSIKEGKRYKELKRQLKQGEIAFLACQVEYIKIFF